MAFALQASHDRAKRGPCDAGPIRIPRAEAAIAQAIDGLKHVQFVQDPLFDISTSFQVSFHNSAVKREGRILEAAVCDAIEQSAHLRSVTRPAGLPRRPDILFETGGCTTLVALEIKRGPQQDAKALRQFRRDLAEIPAMLRQAWPLFPYRMVHFHIIFIDGKPPLTEGLGGRELGKLYDFVVEPHVLAARRLYSAHLPAILQERLP